MSEAGRKRLVTGNVVTLLSTVLWASSFPAVDHLLATWGALPLTVVRLGGASLFLMLLGLLIRRPVSFAHVPWPDVLLLGTIGVGVPAFMTVIGQRFSDPVTVAILATTMPLISAIMGWLDRTEKPHAPVVAGIVLAIAGGSISTLQPGIEAAGPRGGEILILGSLVLWTWYSRAAVRRLSGMPDLSAGALTLGVGALVDLVATLLIVGLGFADGSVDLRPGSLLLAGYMSMFAIGLSVPLWLAGSRLLGVTIAAIHTNLAPFYVMLMALAFGGSVHTFQVIGAVLVAFGALLAQLPHLRRQLAH